MRFYSDELKKLFNSQEELQQAEAAHIKAVNAKKAKEEQLAAQRKVDSERVEKALTEYNKAAENYKKELNQFIEKWGSYHYSTTDPNFKHFLSFWDLLNLN